MNTRIATALACLVTFVLPLKEAAGWDSVTKPRVRNFPTAIPFTPGSAPQSSHRWFGAVFLKDAIGGTSPNYDDDVDNSKILDCPEAFLRSGEIAGGCEIAKDLSHAEFGWLELRKRGDDFTTGEHTAITKVVAERAGLAGSHIFDPFWVRYATPNTYIASPVKLTDDGLTPDASRYLVGQSLTPTGGYTGSVHATRSVSLYEFTQVPDFANSVADWAAGAELCPLEGVDGAFEGPDNDGCHQFMMALGAVNATHFKPLNRWVWTYYHELAKRRMRECSELATKISSATTNWFYEHLSDPKPFSNYATEAHECEREAMLYEMWAQHFLQDAWSTGHMWYRWGKASLPDVNYWLKGERAEDIPVEDRASRRAVMAGVVAATSGMIHGAKSVAIKTLQSMHLQKLLDQPRVTDDPLNSPLYYLDNKPRQVEWSLSDIRHNGGGDLFWRPVGGVSGSVYDDAIFLDQRQHLLNCAAKSLLETYAAGPNLFGDPEPTGQSAVIELVDLSSDECWGQLVTNESMLHSMGVTSGFYGEDGDRAAITFANGAVKKKLVGFSTFPRGDKGKHDGDSVAQARVDRRDAFTSRLGDQWENDLRIIRESYAANAAKSPKGTDSARGVLLKKGKRESINLLGIPPFPDPDPGNTSAIVPYVDRLISEHVPSTELDYATSRVFWRGNIKQTCQETLADDAALLLDLQEECLAGAETTGNPDACTECTYRAEMLMPECGAPDSGGPSGGHLLDSKCSALGVYDLHAPPPGLPSWWFHDNARVRGTLPGEPQNFGKVCSAAALTAMQWCTGTTVYSGQDPFFPYFATDADTQTMRCDNSVMFQAGTKDYRNAGFLWEPAAMEKGPKLNDEQTYDFANGPWLPFMVNAYHEQLNVEPSDDGSCAGVKSTNSLQEILQRNVAPANASEYRPLYNPGLYVPYCGNLQRATYWTSKDADCAKVASDLNNYTIRALDTHFQDTGEYVNEYDTPNGKACLLIEPRKFSPTCSDGVATCNAGWQCVDGQAPPSVRRIGPIDKAEARRFE